MKKNRATTARGEESRERILDITQSLMGGGGGDSVTLDKISQQVGLSKSSILWYFGSKEALMLEVIDRALNTLIEGCIRDIPNDLGPLDSIRMFLKEYERFITSHPDMARIFFSSFFNSTADRSIGEKIREIYELNRQALVDSLNVSPNIATAFMGFLDGVVIQSVIDPERVKVEAVFEEMLEAMEPLFK